MAFDTADDEIGESQKDADAVWEIFKSDTSHWSSYLTTNFDKARDTFLKAYPKKGFTIEGPSKFDEEFKAVPHVGDVYGITEKHKHAITLKEDGVRSSTTRMVFALHELVHWLADPPDQGRHSTSLILLHEGLNEGLTQVVVEDVLDGKQIKRTSLTVYDKRTAIIRAMMKSLGFEPFALTLFKGQYCVLRDAMLNVWNVHTVADLQKLWTFADNNQSDDALKLIQDWNNAAKSRGQTGTHATSCKKTT